MVALTARPNVEPAYQPAFKIVKIIKIVKIVNIVKTLNIVKITHCR